MRVLALNGSARRNGGTAAGARMRTVALTAALWAALSLVGCSDVGGTSTTSSPESQPVEQESDATLHEEKPAAQQPDDRDGAQEADNNDKETGEMRMSIGGTDVNVEWDDNRTVADLRALAAEGPITVELSMYGGFEQVGPLGTSLTTSDVQMTTEPGDIVLYSGNQISVFYGPHSWSYTKLGHVTGRTAEEMAELLGNGNVSITITVGLE